MVYLKDRNRRRKPVNEHGASEAIDRISAQAVALMHVRERFLNDPTDTAYAIKLELGGEVQGLRWALCVLKGWDPVQEADHEEKADRFVRVWHNLPGHCIQPDCGPW